jgi:2-haloacid dehalogenase
MAGPRVLVFDVNETLSDMAPLGDRLTEVGATPHLAATWFSGLLRDGFALTVHGVNPDFAALAREHLAQVLTTSRLDREVDDAVDHVMAGITELRCHPDVAEGVRTLSDRGLRLVTLGNGSATIAQRLLHDEGIADRFEWMLSVEDAAAWKPDPRAYEYAVSVCEVEPADAMLVAVHPWDTDGARRAGLAAAWINRSSVSYPAYFRAPDVEASSLVDLAEQLG